jgi:hypothetical protein
MKTEFSFRLPALILSALLLFGLSARAAAESFGPVTLLDDAYATLSHADHDYKGHRVRAMEQIRLALREQGDTISGKGRGREPQGTSDAQLRAAIGLLEQAKGSLSGRELQRVNAAIVQLNTALSIK